MVSKIKKIQFSVYRTIQRPRKTKKELSKELHKLRRGIVDKKCVRRTC